MACATLIGAALGCVVGFLFLTERGRRVRADLRPRLAEFAQEAQRLQGVAGKLRHAAEGSLNTIVGFISDLAEHRANWRNVGTARDATSERYH
jgi:hypothetical protein